MNEYNQTSDDQGEVERRLAGWKPAGDRLDADAMLFAAGHRSARSGPARFIWPGLTACAAGLALVLGVWLNAEREERKSLARQLQLLPPAAVSHPSPDIAPLEPVSEENWSQSSYLAARPALEGGLGAWPAQPVRSAEPPGPPDAEVPPLQVRNLDVLLAP